MHRNRLEEYLDQLERPLTRLSPAARREWREEARQHLHSLIERTRTHITKWWQAQHQDTS